MKKLAIPILHLPAKSPDESDSSLIHCESLNELASFFGRDMQVHRHDRHYQLHYISNGKVHLSLGENDYHEEGPLFFITPPPTPHRFVTEPTAQGIVLTVHQSIVQALLQELRKDEQVFTPECIVFKSVAPALAAYKEQLLLALKGLSLSTKQPNSTYYQATAQQWVKVVFLNILALIEHVPAVRPSHHSYLSLFRQYLNLIEAHYKTHPTIGFYAQKLNITEAKLNTICKAIANNSAKQLTYDRVTQESKYLLGYTDLYIKEVAFEIGFADPAYFSRFFNSQVGITPSHYRQTLQGPKYANN